MSLCCCATSDDDDTVDYLNLSAGTEIPVKNRKQTDLPCFMTLVIYFSLLVICVSVAGSQGDIRRFMHGYDDQGNLCGFKNTPVEGIKGSGLDLTNKKFLLTYIRCDLYSIHTCWTKKECVGGCKNGYRPWITPTCNAESKNDLVETTKSFLGVVYSDLSFCWREIIILCFVSICLSGLIITALRTFAKIVVRILIVIICVAAIGWSVFTWVMFAVKVVKNNNADPELQVASANEMYSWLYISIGFSVFTLLLFIMMYRMRNKLPLLTALFEEGAKCIKDIPTMLLQPVLTHLVTFVFACLFFFGLICFQTSGKPELDDEGKVYFPVNPFFQFATWLLVFGLLWLSQFFLACQNFVIAGAVSSWYFSRVKGKLTDPVWKSFNMLVKNHLGSAAFGSLLIAIVKLIRMIIKMMERRARSNGLAAIIWCFMQCILACIESILNILNKSAYVMIVLFSEPFCKSAKRAFSCLTSDSSKVAVIIGVETFLLGVIEFLITVTVTLIGIALFMNMEGVQTFWIPAFVVFILSFLCCHCFFSVYEMTIDTLVLCFCVDHQMNDGLEKPYYMNKNLMILLSEDESNPNPNMDGEQNMLFVAQV